MTASPQDDGTGASVEKFEPTGGRVLGYTTLAAIVGLFVYIALLIPTVTGLRVALALAVFGVLVWATQIRPRAFVRDGELWLRNFFRDEAIPLESVDDVTVRRMLEVRVDEERHVCVGIGRSPRAVRRSGRGLPADSSVGGHPERPADYGQYVESRLRDLAAEARRSTDGGSKRPVRHFWAWPEVVALAVTTVAFVVSLLL